ncbi:hypothetical protein [Streptosporangium sp. NPDC006007]|uniref:hypothetical protein n=1 Tax=Streptosporangium sp. NPDC006007 TaxID=3154575 RepID=UPI0033B604DB
MDPAIAVAVIGGGFGIVSMAYTARQARLARLDKTEEDARLARLAAEDGAYRRATEFDIGVQARMQAEITRMQRQITRLQYQVARLTRQITEAGLVPITVPEEDP